MLRKYHRATILSLLGLLLLFAIILLAALFNLRRGFAIFNIGIPTDVENIAVIALSLVAMARIFVSLWKIEHSSELDSIG
jgi:hypothetical protein